MRFGDFASTGDLRECELSPLQNYSRASIIRTKRPILSTFSLCVPRRTGESGPPGLRKPVFPARTAPELKPQPVPWYPLADA